MKIGEKTIEDVQKRVGGLIRMHLMDINGVFEEDGNIKIAMPVDLKMDNGKIKVKVGCSFVTSKIDDTSTGIVDEAQLDLPLEPVRNCPVNPGETRTDKYCNTKCDLRIEVIRADSSDGDWERGETEFIQYRSCAAWSDDDTHARVARLLDWEPAPEPAKVYNLNKKKKARTAK